MPHRNSSCQHELLSKVSLLGSRVEVTNPKHCLKKKDSISDYNSKQTFLTSFPVDITATTGNLLTSTSVTPTVAKRPISDGPMWVPLASTHSPLLMSCPMGLEIRTEKQHERKTGWDPKHLSFSGPAPGLECPWMLLSLTVKMSVPLTIKKWLWNSSALQFLTEFIYFNEYTPDILAWPSLHQDSNF